MSTGGVSLALKRRGSPSHQSTGRPASSASLACRFPPACGLRSPVTSNV